MLFRFLCCVDWLLLQFYIACSIYTTVGALLGGHISLQVKRKSRPSMRAFAIFVFFEEPTTGNVLKLQC